MTKHNKEKQLRIPASGRLGVGQLTQEGLALTTRPLDTLPSTLKRCVLHVLKTAAHFKIVLSKATKRSLP